MKKSKNILIVVILVMIFSTINVAIAADDDVPWIRSEFYRTIEVIHLVNN